jgi:hypothetical protein
MTWAGIEAAQRELSHAAHVAVFDTAFHQVSGNSPSQHPARLAACLQSAPGLCRFRRAHPHRAPDSDGPVAHM